MTQQQMGHSTASLETSNKAVYTGYYFRGIQGMGKAATESSKATLGGEPTPAGPEECPSGEILPSFKRCQQ